MLKGFRYWFVALALTFVGPVFVYLEHVHATELAAIADHGKPTVADIDSIEWSKGGRTGIESKFKINVTFITESGQTVHKKLAVDGGHGREIRDNEQVATVKLNYLPENPQVAFLDGETADEGLSQKIGGGMFVIGLGMLVFGLLRRKKAA